MDISFIVLTWNSGKYIENCLDSIIHQCKQEGLNGEIIIIDNGSKDSTLGIIDTYDASQVNCVRLGFNHGTTYSRNIGLKIAKGNYLCIIDSDTYFISGEIRGLLDKLDNSPGVAMIAPQLILPDGTVQNSVKKFPTFFQKLMKIQSIIFKSRYENSDFYDVFPFEEEKDVESAISACWFFKKELIETVGYLDEKIFYSPEDLDYCYRIRKSGKRILYDPEFKVRHVTQQISHKKPMSKSSISHLMGLVYYFRKHGGWFRVGAQVRVDETAIN